MFLILNWQEFFVIKFTPIYSIDIYTTNFTITIEIKKKTIKHYCNVDKKNRLKKYKNKYRP